MAIKPTIFKFKVSLADMNRDIYDNFDLTVAQHPSETAERMMVRILAYCINYQEHLLFSKGISTPEEPDIWAHSLDGQILSWIDVGEPSPERIKKASRLCKSLKVYRFNSKSNVWWEQGAKDFLALKADFYRFPWESTQALALLLERTMDLSLSLSGNSIFISSQQGDCEVIWEQLSPQV